MAGKSYRKKGYGSYRATGYSKKSYASRKRRYAKAAAAQQRDLAKFTINVPTKLTVFNKTVNIPTSITDNTKFATKTIGCYALNVYDLLRKSAFFQNYSGMFDEFKINNVSVKLTPSSYLVSGGQRYTAITVFTAWDRSGLEDSQTFLNLASATRNSTSIGSAADQDGLYVTLGNEVTTYSSAQSRSLNPNTNTSITRYISPKALLEKSQYLSTDSLRQWYDGFDNLKGRYYGIPVESESAASMIGVATNMASNGSLQDNANWNTRAYRNSPAVKENPCFLLEDNAIAFKPTLLIGIYPQDTFEEMVGNGPNTGYTTTSVPNPLYTNVKEASDTWLTINPQTEQIPTKDSYIDTNTNKCIGWNVYVNPDGDIELPDMSDFTPSDGYVLLLDNTGKTWNTPADATVNTQMTEAEKTNWKAKANPYTASLSSIPQFIQQSTPIVSTNANAGSVTQNPIIFNVEADIDVQFRGVRKAQQV